MLLLAILRFLAFVGLAVFVSYVGLPTTHTLMEYQRAVLYRRGRPLKEVGGGRYWIWTKFEKLIFVDTRPIQVGYEDQSALLKDATSRAFGILASVRVVDARKAIYSARNYNEVGPFVLMGCTRAVLNEMVTSDLVRGKDVVAEEIVTRVTPRLTAAGFELISFRFTQFPVSK